jgi:hypothetical protein
MGLQLLAQSEHINQTLGILVSQIVLLALRAHQRPHPQAPPRTSVLQILVTFLVMVLQLHVPLIAQQPQLEVPTRTNVSQDQDTI